MLTINKMILIFCAIGLIPISSLFNPVRAEEVQGEILSLEEAINEAILRSPLIKEAREKTEASRSEYKSARADMWPKFSASYSFTQLMDQPIVKMHDSELPMSGKDIYKWNVTVSQPLFTGFALSTKRRMAKLGVKIGKIEKQISVIDLVLKVKETYFGILITKRVYEVSQDEVKLLEHHHTDAENFLEQGLISTNDLLKTKVALANAKLKREKALKNYRMAIEGMNFFLNRPIDGAITVKDVTEPASAKSFNQALFIKKGLNNRPEVKALTLAVKNANNAIRLVESQYYPHLMLIGRFEREGENFPATENEYMNDHNALISIMAKWTFFEWGKTKNDVDRMIHTKRSLLEKLTLVKRNIALDVKDALLDIEVSKKNIDTSREGLEQAKENYRITDVQYKQQMTTSTEVLDATTFLSGAKISYYSSLYGYRIALARLDRAIGEIGVKAINEQ
ncbi:MAG: TolC family protein [Spirochaetota bacterium]|nr:TolC family protein [Spirochaetota bacterium]